MSLRKQLSKMVEGMPPGSSISVPCDWLRSLLAEDERAGDVPDELLTLEEVGERMSRAVGTIRTWCNSGQLEGAFRLNGRDWRIPSSVLQAYVENQQNPQDTPGPDDADDDLGAWRRIRKGKAA